MKHHQDHETFQYTYSAKEQEELQKIRSKYMPKEESKLDQLYRLDAHVTQRATVRSVTTGFVGALIMGCGMSLAMTDIGASIGLGNLAMLVGILVGIVGMALVGIAYPVYFHALKKERAKIAPEILRLTDELMNQG